MNRATFFKHFELLADQPNAVTKMRELVLELAVRGKLISNGTKADDDEAWAKFSVEATASNTKLSPAFNGPGHWHWARLEDVAAPCGQKKPDTRFTYVDVGAIDNERGVIKEDVEIVEAENAPSRARKLVTQNSVIFSTVRPYLKNIAIVDRKFSPSAIVSTAFAVLHPMDFLQSRYLFYWLRSRPFQSDVESKMKGVAYPAISDSELWQCLIPVPPPAEQRRIVAKVDELMALCDELEQRQQARQHASAILQQSALHHILAAREPQTSAIAWQRVRNHFHQLHDTPDAIPQLRQAILQLAVQGRLVKQDSNHETATVLLKKIRLEKERMVKAGDLREQEALLGIDQQTVQYPLPSSWIWVRLQDLAYLRSGIVIQAEDETENGKTPYLKVADLSLPENRDGITMSSRYVDRDIAGSIIKAGSILFPKRGGAIATNRKRLSQVDVMCDPNLMAMRPFLPELTNYVRLWFDGFDLWQLNSGTSVPQINNKDIYPLHVPLPPLAEQKRIVARVEELLRFCNTLEAQLNQTRTLGAQLLNSTLHHLLAA